MSQPAVIFGGPSPEHDISILSGLLVSRALATAGRQPIGLYWSRAGDWFEVDAGALEGIDFRAGLPPRARPLRLLTGPGGGFVSEGGALRKDRPLAIHAAVVCCHGGPGEDGTLQAALDLGGVAYTGPDAAGAALGMDKLAFGAVAAQTGLPSLPRVLFDDAIGWAPPFAGPYIVKPRFGGSSIGISTVTDVAAIGALVPNSVHLRAGAVIEPYCRDVGDLEVAVRSHPRLELSPISRPLRAGGEIYGYKDKYVGGQGMLSAPREMNPVLPPGMADAIRDATRAVAVFARLRGVARVDFLVDGDQWWLNEINTIPGSLAKHLWEPDVKFVALLDALLDEAIARPTTAQWTTAGADGSALQSAGGIDGKLG